VGDVAAQPSSKLSSIVGVDLRVVPSTGYSHIGQATIHELFACLLGVHMNQDAVGGLSLAAVACDRIPVIEMRILLDVERDGAPRV